MRSCQVPRHIRRHPQLLWAVAFAPGTAQQQMLGLGSTAASFRWASGCCLPRCRRTVADRRLVERPQHNSSCFCHALPGRSLRCREWDGGQKAWTAQGASSCRQTHRCYLNFQNYYHGIVLCRCKWCGRTGHSIGPGLFSIG